MLGVVSRILFDVYGSWVVCLAPDKWVFGTKHIGLQLSNMSDNKNLFIYDLEGVPPIRSPQMSQIDDFVGGSSKCFGGHIFSRKSGFSELSCV